MWKKNKEAIRRYLDTREVVGVDAIGGTPVSRFLRLSQHSTC
jgi:hypothetical protein